MPHAFLQVGSRWINLDLVTRIDELPHPGSKALAGSVRVHFMHGLSQDFTDPADVQVITNWLQAHKAP